MRHWENWQNWWKCRLVGMITQRFQEPCKEPVQVLKLILFRGLPVCLVSPVSCSFPGSWLPVQLHDCPQSAPQLPQLSHLSAISSLSLQKINLGSSPTHRLIVTSASVIDSRSVAFTIIFLWSCFVLSQSIVFHLPSLHSSLSVFVFWLWFLITDHNWVPKRLSVLSLKKAFFSDKQTNFQLSLHYLRIKSRELELYFFWSCFPVYISFIISQVSHLHNVVFTVLFLCLYIMLPVPKDWALTPS